MGKFTIECPKCGSFNTASTFILAKKKIKCGSCGEEINIKESRLASKVCPGCGSVVVCDQAKLNGKKCPVCGEKMSVLSATAKYSMVTINCPQCACPIEIDKTKEKAVCPICDCGINVNKEIKKAKLVNDMGVSVIQYEGDNATFVWKHPIEDFNLGSQLIVHESQEAVFFLNGEALDTFSPGRHTLETENLPVLKKIYSLPTGTQSPFHAEVYFINKSVLMGMKWGTDSRVRFIDPISGIPLDIGASGEMNIRVADSRKLLFKLVGTTGGLTNKDILSDETSPDNIAKTLRNYFRAPLMTEIKSYLAAVIKEQKINILEIDEHISTLSDALRERVSPKFEEYGIIIPQFYITTVSLPEDDKNFAEIKELISQAYLGVKSEEVKTNVTAAALQRKLIEEQAEAQLRVIHAQSESEAAKAKGIAEAEIMRAKGYSEKDVLISDVQKAYAEGIGKLGGGDSGKSTGGTAGGVASDLVGMMAGIKMAGTMLDKMDGIMTPTSSKPVDTWSCSCGESGNTKNFCMNCGKPRAAQQNSDTWECTECHHKGNRGRFCEECGAEKAEGWSCNACGEKNNKGRFCAGCGAKKPE